MQETKKSKEEVKFILFIYLFSKFIYKMTWDCLDCSLLRDVWKDFIHGENYNPSLVWNNNNNNLVWWHCHLDTLYKM